MLAKLLHERWVFGSGVALTALYVALIALKPSGEGFGRGWNLIAFWIYGSPAALALGGIGFWRSSKTSGKLKIVALVLAWLGVAFPVLAMLVMRAKS